MNVGIVWSGNRVHEQAHHRDIPLVHFLRLAEIPGVRLHSLQVGEQVEELREIGAYGLVRDRSPEITNFADTARIVAEMDLIVTVDTAVVHLAGAMGKRTWLLLNMRGMDWRWGSCGNAVSLWYPSVKCFLRRLDEDWAAVMSLVDTALRTMVVGWGEEAA